MTNEAEPTLGKPPAMRAEVELRVGKAISLHASASATPAGLAATGCLVSLVMLSAAATVWVVRGPSR